jgi:putative transposase
MYLWRAVDSAGEILDILVQPKRDAGAVLNIMCKLLKKQDFTPSVLVTDKFQYYGAARRKPSLSAHYEQGRHRNNRVEPPIKW